MDSNVVLRANQQYVLGAPKISEIDVRFIADPTTLVANVLSGLDMSLGKTISLDQALQARDQWHAGTVLTKPQNWTPISVQFINTSPTVVTQLQFRKAMIEALDRQQLTDSIFSGQSMVANSFVLPNTPMYNLVEPGIVKYSYDLRDATQLVEGLG